MGDDGSEPRAAATVAARPLSEIWKRVEEADRKLRSAILRILKYVLVAGLCLAAVTLLAVGFGSRLGIAIIGYGVTVLLVTCFAFAHLIANAFKYVEVRMPTGVLRLPLSFGFGAIVFVRSIILFVAEWLVDLYVSLCSGGLHGFIAAVSKNNVLTMLFLAISFLNLGTDGKNRIGRLASRVLSTYGYFFFFASICSLSLAILSSHAFHASLRIFQWPPWFLTNESEAYVRAGLSQSGLYSVPALMAIIPLVIGVAGTPHDGELREDVTHMSVALVAFLCLTALAYLV